MYSDEIFKSTIEKLNTFIDNYLNTLREQLQNIITSLSYEKTIKSIRNSKNLESILEAKDIFISLDPNMKEKFHILEYFIKNDAPDVEQVDITINSILDSNVIKNYSNNLQAEKEFKQQLEDSISIITQVKEDSDVDFNIFLKLLEASDLTEEEKIIILTKKAHDSCLSTKKDKKQATLTSEEIAKLSNLEKEYEPIASKINEILNKNYYLIEGKTDKELTYAKVLSDNYDEILESTTKNDEKLRYQEYVMIAKLISLIEEKKQIEDIFAEINDKQIFTNNIEEEIQLHFMEVKDLLKDIDQLNKSVEKNSEDNNSKEAKVIFLLDVNGNPYFNLQDYNNEDKKKIYSLVEKLEKGIEQVKKGVKHSKLMSKTKLDHDVFINKLSNMFCSYVRLNNDVILIITFGDKDSIYDESESIVRKSSLKITKLKHSTKEMELAQMDPKQNDILNKIEEYKTKKGNEL